MTAGKMSMRERKMRRSRQEIPNSEVLRILDRGKVAVWSVAGDEDYPYGVPINYVYNNGYIYIHSAKAGHKIDAIAGNPKCSICIIEKDDIIPEKFTSYFRSVIAFGKAEIINSIEDKIDALKLLCNKYCFGLDPTEEINRFIKNVEIIRIYIEKATGKEAIELVADRK